MSKICYSRSDVLLIIFFFNSKDLSKDSVLNRIVRCPKKKSELKL
jgi:hypothetical protein